jgi:hypothetical protein
MLDKENVNTFLVQEDHSSIKLKMIVLNVMSLVTPVKEPPPHVPLVDQTPTEFGMPLKIPVTVEPVLMVKKPLVKDPLTKELSKSTLN